MTHERQLFNQGCNILRWWYEAWLLPTQGDFLKARGILENWYSNTLFERDMRFREGEWLMPLGYVFDGDEWRFEPDA